MPVSIVARATEGKAINANRFDTLSKTFASRLTRRGAIGAMVAFATLPFAGSVNAQDAPALAVGCSGEHGAVVPGCTVPAGMIALTEEVHRHDSTIHLHSGVLETDFVTGQDLNAWGPFSSVEEADAAAYATADARLGSADFANYKAFVNGAEYNGIRPAAAAQDDDGAQGDDDAGDDALDDMSLQDEDGGENEDRPMVTDPGVYTEEEMARYNVECRAAKSAGTPNRGTGESDETSIYEGTPANELPDMGDADSYGLAVPAGICINEGLLVVRSVRHGVGGWEDVRAIQVGGDNAVYCGKHGGISYDCWELYPSPDAAIYAACEQARGDLETVDDEGAFNYRFRAVLYNGGDVPVVCK